jgi:hypothetical protein
MIKMRLDSENRDAAGAGHNPVLALLGAD